MPIEREEFETWMNLLRSDIHGVQDRLDTINGRTRVVEQAIAVLEDRRDTGKAAAWGGGIAGGVVAVVEAAKWLLGK